MGRLRLYLTLELTLWVCAPSSASAQSAAELGPSSPAGASSPESLNFASARPEAKRTLSHKVFVRTSSGIISNVGTITGSGFSYGGASIGGAFFVTEQISLGIAYKVETNFSSVPLKGFDLFGRYYFLGSGTVVTTRDSFGNRSVRQRSWSPYIGGEYSNRDFYVEGDPEAVNVEDRAVAGTLSSVNVSAGLDYRISRHWEFTAEFNMTLLPFAGSDPRVKIRWMLGSFGANYVF